MMIRKYSLTVFVVILVSMAANLAYCQDDDSTKNVLKNGLIGAGTGAIAAGASGGKAGQGALIGAGTAVIGGALLDALTTPSRPARRAAPVAQQDDYYYSDQPEEYYEEEVPHESSTQKVLKQGLVGAGTGALAAGASGGKAGQGALIGAGTAVVGGALLDMLTTPSQPKTARRVYRRPQQVQQQQLQPIQSQHMQTQNFQVQEEQAGVEGGKKKVVKKYDASGKLVSEEEIYY